MNRDYPSEIDILLNKFHNTAASADFEGYFSCFSTQGSFLGTDGHENWSVDEFKEYSMPHFQGESAWIYNPIANSRRCKCLPSSPVTPSIATFDELLTSPSMKIQLRGSGVLIFDVETMQWLILSYHLSFSIPDDTVPEIDKIVGKHMMRKPHRATLEQRETEAARAAAELLGKLDAEVAPVGSSGQQSGSKKSKNKKKK
jgi:hypothetical protein